MVAFMAIVWAIAVKVNDFSIVDIAWGMTFIITTIATLAITQNMNITSITIAVLVILWGLRLSGYLFKRNVGKPEDYRYQNMRKRWETNVNLKAFYRVYMLQGALSLFFSIPIIIGIANSSEETNYILITIGVVLWIIGFIFEAGGDYQLSQFKKKEENKGRFIKHGLWRYTRHPNYFGESAMWFGVAIVALSVPWGWIGLISPIALTYILINISGVPPLEKKFMEHEEYREYAKKTNMFIPGPPKK